jgi:hypothetical protein
MVKRRGNPPFWQFGLTDPRTRLDGQMGLRSWKAPHPRTGRMPCISLHWPYAVHLITLAVCRTSHYTGRMPYLSLHWTYAVHLITLAVCRTSQYTARGLFQSRDFSPASSHALK